MSQSSSIPSHLEQEIAIYETQLALKSQGKIDDKVFAETRLRRGVYGQRYDNGQRHDGVQTQQLNYPCGELTKGPQTVWDAPGMQRIKIPFGGLNADQLDTLADVAEEYSDAIDSLKLYIHYLRQKLEINPDRPEYILTLRGVGYRFIDR